MEPSTAKDLITFGNTAGLYFTQWRIDLLVELVDGIIYNYGTEPLVDLQDIVIDYDPVEDYHRLAFTANNKQFAVRFYKVYSATVDGVDLWIGCPRHKAGEFARTIRNIAKLAAVQAETRGEK